MCSETVKVTDQMISEVFQRPPYVQTQYPVISIYGLFEGVNRKPELWTLWDLAKCVSLLAETSRNSNAAGVMVLILTN